MTAPVILPPLALTMGEPAGIGGQIALKAWRRREQGIPPFFLIDDPDRLSRLSRTLGIETPVAAIEEPEEAAGAFPRALPVLVHPLPVAAPPGHPVGANAATILRSIERGAAFSLAGRAAGVVTNPVHKATLADAGLPFAGHTEYLAEVAGSPTPPVMMLACPGLRVVPVTRHLSLREAIDQLDVDSIVAAAKTTVDALIHDFQIERPRLAIAALNPHGGEGGLFGDEEGKIIRPAVEVLRTLGFDVAGPVPADALFHAAARQGYDAALCMYHDQALIPLKTLDFAHGVNITLGLPLVRTSPAHGTALSIAAAGTASETSLIAALEMAAQLAARRHRRESRSVA